MPPEQQPRLERLQLEALGITETVVLLLLGAAIRSVEARS